MSRLAALLFDAAMLPLERAAIGRWRRRLWQALPARGRGLEVGVGTGANFAHHPRGVPVVAIDVSEAMIRRARHKESRAELAFVVADAGALPFRDGAFAWATATLVYCEVPEPSAAFEELARVLEPGAPCVLLEHVRPGGWLGRVAEGLTRVTGPLFHEYFDRDTEATLRESPFVLERRTWMWRDVFVLLEARRRRQAA